MDLFFKLAGLDGECTDAKHPKWIELESVNGLDITAPPSQAEIEAEELKKSDDPPKTLEPIAPIQITKKIDGISPNLASYACYRSKFKGATIDFCTYRGEQQLYLQYKLYDLELVSYSSDGKKDTCQFKFKKIEWAYFNYNPSKALAAEGSYCIEEQEKE